MGRKRNGSALAFAALCSLGVMVGCGRGIPVVGLDDNGNSVEERLPAKIYSAKLGEVLGGAEQSVLGALETQAGNPGWELRTVVVALGAKGELGAVGPVKVSAAPRFSLGFTRGKNPPIP